MNYNDKRLLEALVKKYGNDGVNIAINKLNESEKSLFCGIPEVYLHYYGEWSDPELEYDDCVCNYWDIENSMINYMEECIKDGEDWGDPSNDDDFCKFCQAHAAEVKNDIVEFSGCRYDINESLNENEENVIVLFNDLPENDDQYRDAYEEDIEDGDIDPNVTSYEEYADRLNTIYVKDLEEQIKDYDADMSYPYYLVVNQDDDRENEVFNDLWKAIFRIAAGSYFSVKQVGGHIELEISRYNSQHRSYYSIYLLNDDGVELYDDGNWDDLNDPKYWQSMKPIM